MSLLKSILKRVKNIDLDTLLLEHEETLTELSRLQREHEDLIVNLTSIKDENTQLKEDIEKWATYKSNYELKVAALQNNLNKVGTLSSEQAQRIKNLENTVEKANAALDLLKKNNRILQVNCDTAVKTLEQKDNVIKELEGKIQQQEEIQQQKINSITSSNEDTVRRLNEALGKVSKLSSALESAEQKVNEAEERGRLANEENLLLKEENQSYLENLKKLDGQIIDMQEKHQIQIELLKKAEGQISKNQEDSDFLLNQLSTLQEEVERLHAVNESNSSDENMEKNENSFFNGAGGKEFLLKNTNSAENGDEVSLSESESAVPNFELVEYDECAICKDYNHKTAAEDHSIAANEDCESTALDHNAIYYGECDNKEPDSGQIKSQDENLSLVLKDKKDELEDVLCTKVVAEGEIDRATEEVAVEETDSHKVGGIAPVDADKRNPKSNYRFSEILDNKEGVLDDAVSTAIQQMIERGETPTPYQKGKKWGFVYGEVVLVSPTYTDYEDYGDHGDILVKGNRCVGLLNKYGQELIPCKYLEFKVLENGMALGADAKHHYILGTDIALCQRKPNDEFSFVRETEKIVKVHVSNEKYSNQFDFYILDDACFFFKLLDDSYQLVTWTGRLLGRFVDFRYTQDREKMWVQDVENKKWRLMDLDGCLLSEFSYDRLEQYRFGETDCNIGISQGRSAIYDIYGNTLCMTDYDNLKVIEVQDLFFCLATQGEKKGIVTLNGEILVPIAYDDVSYSPTSCFFVATDLEKSFFYTLQGRLVTLPEEGMICRSAYHYLEISKENLWGLMDADSNIVLEVKYESITYLAKFGAFVLKQNDLASLFVPEQLLLKTLPSGEVKDLNEHFLIVYNGDLCGLVDHTCRFILPIAYQAIFPFSETSEYLGLRKDDSKYGIADANGKICVEPQFKNVYYMTEDIFRLEVEDGWFLYKISRGIISAKYAYIYPYEGGATIKVTKVVHDLSVVGNVDLSGHEIVTSETPLENNCKIVEIFGKWGVTDAEGTYIVPLVEGRKLEKLSKDFLKCTQSRKCGVMDVNNHLIVNFSFSDVIYEEGSRYFILKQSEENTYSWLRSEGNAYYQLMGIDGTQDEIPEAYRVSYSSMSFVTPNIVQLPDGLLSLNDFTFAEGKFQKVSSDEGLLYVENMYARRGVLSNSMKTLVPCVYDKIEKLGDHLIKCQTTRSSLYSSTQKNKEYDLFTHEGHKVNCLSLDTVGSIKKEGIEVKLRGRVGRLSPEGDILPTATLAFKDDLKAQCKLGFWEITNRGKVILPIDFQADAVEYLDSNVICVKKNYLYGVIREDGSEILPCQYENIEKWNDGILKVGLQGYELFTYDGAKCSEHSYSKIGNFHGEKVIAVRVEDNVQGWLDATGNETFNEEIHITDHLLKHEVFGKWELVDSEGNILSDCMFDEVKRIDDERIEVRVGEEFGVYSSSGEVYVPVGYAALEYPSKDDVIANENGRYCLFHKNKQVIEDSLSIHLWNDNIFLCKKGNASSSGFSLIDGEGTVLTKHIYDEIRPLDAEGKAETICNGRWGWLDRLGREICDEPEFLSENYLKRQSSGCYEVLDRQGNVVIPAQYTEVQVYQEDVFLVYLDQLKGLVNCRGEILIPVKYDSIQVFDENCYLVRVKDCFGLFNANFHLVIPADYKSIRILQKGKYVAESLEGLVFYDKEGHLITDETFEAGGRIEVGNLTEETHFQKSETDESLISKMEFLPIAEGEICKGEVIQIVDSGVMLRLTDTRTVLLHKSSFEAIGFQNTDVEKGWFLTIKKVGTNDVQQMEVWEILDINPPSEDVVAASVDNK